jgi:hypothetical protein
MDLNKSTYQRFFRKHYEQRMMICLRKGLNAAAATDQFVNRNFFKLVFMWNLKNHPERKR